MFQSLAASLSVGELTGNGRGLVRVYDKQRLSILGDFARTHINSNVRVFEGGRASFPTTTYKERTLENYGQIDGVQHLFIMGYVMYHHTGYGVCDSGANALRGQYWLTTLTVMDAGTFETQASSTRTLDTGIIVRTDSFDVEHRGRVFVAGAASLHSQRSYTEKLSIIQGLMKGYDTNSGPGAGTTCPGCGPGSGGTGGGYGGRGGRVGRCNGGPTYHQACLPSSVGSPGGDCGHSNTGGRGADAWKITASRLLEHEGTVRFDGERGTGGGGGASGGAIWMDGGVIEGWGQLYTVGGAAGQDCCRYCYHGCCAWHYGAGGGGGRIRSYSPNYAHKVLLFDSYPTAGIGGYAGQNGEIGTKCSWENHLCSGHGTWDSNGKSCQCNDGFYGDDCQFACATNTTCNGHGQCNAHGGCNCKDGYVGYQCEHQCRRENTCSGHGTCTECGGCVCDPCYTGADCSVRCSDSGQCVAGKCACDACHLGDHCESTCNGHGVCAVVSGQPGCRCHKGWRGEKCTLPGCPGHDGDCSGHGYCNGVLHTCICKPGWTGKEFIYCTWV